MPDLSRRARASLAFQSWAGRILGIVWLPLAALFLRFGLGYRIRDVRRVRREYRRFLRSGKGGVLICANHLTMIDSALIAWGLGGSAWYVVHYRHFPWNLPERRNFAFNPLARLGAWVAKCIPVIRRGDRGDTSDVMDRIRHLLAKGDSVLIFPEGGRSRSGRVDPESVTYGVGRLLAAVPDARTVCVYLRGDEQETWSTIPPRGDSFHLEFEPVDPESSHTGLRRIRDLSRQIIGNIVEMERRYLGDGERSLSDVQKAEPTEESARERIG